MIDALLFFRLVRMRRNVGLVRAVRWAAALVWNERKLAKRL